MEITDKVFEGERALFSSNNLKIYNTVFQNGESPLKESVNIALYNCSFKWKYPLWYCKDIVVYDSVLDETARSGIWYTDNIKIKNTIIKAPKTFRRSRRISLINVEMTNALETLWNCSNVNIINTKVKGDYFGFGSSYVVCENLEIDGNYSFDGGKNIIVKNSKLISKDAFWNCENVEVYDSVIVGEYLGWNSKNVKFVNCKIESLQGLCYMENLEIIDCEFSDTTLAFEYSSVNATIKGSIDSIKNPKSGTIKVQHVKELILDM